MSRTLPAPLNTTLTRGRVETLACMAHSTGAELGCAAHQKLAVAYCGISEYRRETMDLRKHQLHNSDYHYIIKVTFGKKLKMEA
ncbi:hypothetical protein NDU88_000467 [Pleurodeles waltl]|uniref:Uncharacterized protein n=1 Tax=Pleurodeles waltl TaxID=8319 RepID=A0AAV7LA94_PLEWA|nr:hypothetical protein NDU88_000467 [Pleurodeles waltl]